MIVITDLCPVLDRAQQDVYPDTDSIVEARQAPKP